MTSPLSPIIVNGVMFAVSSGEYHPAAGSSASASERATKSTPAVLYALDAASGQQYWSSAKTVTSFVAGTPLWVGAGQVYLATYDNTVYAFGFAEERYSTGQ
jgi:outer membrane protein assembly factor BamB